MKRSKVSRPGMTKCASQTFAPAISVFRAIAMLDSDVQLRAHHAEVAGGVDLSSAEDRQMTQRDPLRVSFLICATRRRIDEEHCVGLGGPFGFAPCQMYS